MAQHNDFGTLGEETACRYLAHLDYRLLERNWRAGHLEVDIIADHYGEIVFVEVKARHRETEEFTALGAVDAAKKRHLIEAARTYLARHAINAPFRFDIITVVGGQPPFNITHYQNAYTTRSIRRRTRF
ncbi:MAG: YraN family protein [Alloprevotella sp.]|nr:YraN family protein [Alloprevotella sp.]